MLGSGWCCSSGHEGCCREGEVSGVPGSRPRSRGLPEVVPSLRHKRIPQGTNLNTLCQDTWGTNVFNACLPLQRVPMQTMPAYLSKGYLCKQCLPTSPKCTNVNNAYLPLQRISSHKISANLPKEYKVIQYLPTIPKEY